MCVWGGGHKQFWGNFEVLAILKGGGGERKVSPLPVINYQSLTAVKNVHFRLDSPHALVYDARDCVCVGGGGGGGQWKIKRSQASVGQVRNVDTTFFNRHATWILVTCEYKCDTTWGISLNWHATWDKEALVTGRNFISKIRHATYPLGKSSLGPNCGHSTMPHSITFHRIPDLTVNFLSFLQ